MSEGVEKWNSPTAWLVRGSEAYASAVAAFVDPGSTPTDEEQALLDSLEYDSAYPLPLGIDPTV